MEPEVREIATKRILMVGPDGPQYATSDAARDLVEDAMNAGANVVAVPVTRLAPEFFQLRTGIAGDLIQRVLNYHIAFAVVGDISAFVAESDALRDFVIECDRGSDVIFAADTAALEARLAAS